MPTKHDALRQSEECAYLEARIEFLRGALAGIGISCAVAPPEVTQKVAAMAIDADDFAQRKWEHSGLNEQP